MILRIITGEPSEATEKDVAEKMDLATQRGFKINEKLSTTHYDPRKSLLIFSLWFTKAGKSRDAMRSRLEFVTDQTPIEIELLKCRKTKNLNHVERERIGKSGITLEDAVNLSKYYEAHWHLDNDKQSRRSMKKEFKTIVNNLVGQCDIAREWDNKRRPRPTVTDEPDWDWKDISCEFVSRGDLSYRAKEWNDLTKTQQESISRLRRR